jgi:hypothetical protein
MGCLKLTYDFEPILFLEEHPEKNQSADLQVWVNPDATFEGVGIKTLTQDDPTYADVTAKFNSTLAGTKDFFTSQAKIYDERIKNAIGYPSSMKAMIAMKIEFFREQVTNGGPYDIKVQGKGYSQTELGGQYAYYNGNLLRYDDFGNYNFGVAAKAFGISLEVAKMGAGLNQIAKGTPDLGNPAGYFDHRQDTQMIINGYYQVYAK